MKTTVSPLVNDDALTQTSTALRRLKKNGAGSVNVAGQEKRYRMSFYSLQLVRENSYLASKKHISGPEDVVSVLRPYFDGLTTEHFIMMCLNSTNRVVGIHTVTTGTLNGSLVHPREVFTPALLHGGCAAIVISHNHPSGNPEPSREDIAITKQLVEAGKILGIPVHDHVVIGADDFTYTSFAQRGLM